MAFADHPLTPPGPPAGRGGTARIDVGFGPNARQSRWTVLIRVLLVLPQWIILYFLSLAAFVVVVIGWFAALFTGRLPEFAADFLSGVLRWRVRVDAYAALLTDRYPPFSLDPVPNYPVQVATRPGPLNRLAVLFRIVLGIPGVIYATLAVAGSVVFSIVLWVICLVLGRVPDSFAAAYRSVVRFNARITGYMSLLTSEYPWGLFGDEQGAIPGAEPTALSPTWGDPAAFPPPPPSTPGWGGPSPDPGIPPALGEQPSGPLPGGAGAPPQPVSDPPAEHQPPLPAGPPAYGPPPAPGSPAAPAAPPQYGFTPQYGAPESGAPQYGAPSTAPPPPPSWPPPAAPLPPADAPFWRIAFTTGSTVLVAVFLVLGILAYAGDVAVVVAAGGGTTQARQDVESAYNTLHGQVQTYNTNVSGCQHRSDQLSCLEAQDRQAARDFRSFSTKVDNIDFPVSSQARAGTVATTALEITRSFETLVGASSLAAYQSTAQSLNINGQYQQLVSDYEQLLSTLGVITVQ